MERQDASDVDGDNRHDFRQATVSPEKDEIVDDQGHEFQHGRAAPRDEAETA